MRANGVSTLADVARKAGVSKVAASVVLNGARANARVSAETRKRIHEAARELNYHPNAVARSLRRRQTHIIGLYNGYGISDTHKPFNAEIISGLELGCEAFGKN